MPPLKNTERIQWTLPSSVPTRPKKKRQQPWQSSSSRNLPVRRSISPAARGALGAEIARSVRESTRRKPVDDGNFLSDVGGFFVNVGKGVAPIPAGISRLIFETGKDVFTGDLEGLVQTGKDIGTGIKQDLGFTFGPLLDLDIKEFGRRFYDEPVRVGSSAAIVYPAVGAGVGAGLRAAGKATGSKALQRAGSREYVPKEGEAPPRRFREPEMLRPPGITEAEKIAVRARRPRSANPITREFQRYISDPIISGARAALGAIPSRRNPFTPEARFDRAVKKGTVNRTYQFVQSMDQDVLRASAEFQNLSRKIGRKYRNKLAPAVYMTVAMRSMGLNNLSKTQTSRTWGLEGLTETWRKSLDEMTPEQRDVYGSAIQKNIDTASRIKPEWMDPKTAPKVINDMVDESIKLLDMSTTGKIDAGVITPETAAFSARRAQYIAAGLSDEMNAATRKFKDYSKRSRIATVRGARVDAAKDRVAQLVASGADNARIERARASLKAAEDKLAKTVSRRDRVLDEANAIRAGLDAEIGPEMSPGSYFPNIEVLGKRQKTSKRPLASATPRRTVPDEKTNYGVTLRRGTPSFAPDVTLNALVESIDIAARSNAMTQIVERYVVKGKDGLPITGEAAETLARLPDGRYQAFTKEELLKQMAAADMGDSNVLNSLIESMPLPKTKYLVPTSVMKGWRAVLGNRENIIDTLNSYWKGGVLALNPRWYIQNGVGMGLQFALGAGLDIQAMFMAARKKYTDRIMADVDASGLSSDLGELARRMNFRPTKNVLKRTINFGYKWNNRMESYYRRAMFWHVAGKRMRQEGKTGAGTFVPGRGSAELAEGWLDFANAAAKGDAKASQLIDQMRIETTRFMGEYARYNAFERAFLRRVFPFYGWLRSIMRLSLALPVKHPVRAGLLSSASTAMYYMYNDDESHLLDPYVGIISGEYFIQTSIMAPQETLRPFIEAGSGAAQALASGDIGEVAGLPTDLAQAALRQAGPIASIPASITGRSLLGIPTRFGEDEDVFRDPQSGREYRFDDVTGEIVDVQRTPSPETLIEQQFPLIGLARRVATPTGMRPTSDANLSSLASWYLRGQPEDEVPRLFYADPNIGRSQNRISRGVELGSALAGIPVTRYDPEVAALNALQRQRRAVQGMKSGARNAQKARMAYLQGRR